MTLIEGKKIAEELKLEIAAETAEFVAQGGKKPHLAAILVGSDGASETYVGHKVKACERVGFTSSIFRFRETITQTELIHKITQINNNADIDGLIVQLPLPNHINEQQIIEAIAPAKDVDGFHPLSIGKLVAGLDTFVSATPAGIMELIKRYKIETSGKYVVVIGRSNIVGRPVSILLSQKTTFGNATVTLCHSRTENLKQLTIQADIVIAALGIAEFLTGDMVKAGAVVIDVGITRVKSDKTKSGWKLLGDVHFDSVAPKTSYITPVPGGVGPMTIVALLKNTLLAAQRK